MAKVQLLTLSSVTGLFNYRGLYTVAYGFVYGMSVWVTFFGGIIAFKTLPRQQFGNLQHRTFPIYFSISMGLTSALLGVWTWTHPDVFTQLARPRVADVAQAYTLATTILTQAANLFIVGPMTSRTMFQRHRLEKEEGKSYNDAGVSDKMKALNKTFGALHGVSSLLNLTSVLALAFHGLWIGTYGIGGY